MSLLYTPFTAYCDETVKLITEPSTGQLSVIATQDLPIGTVIIIEKSIRATKEALKKWFEKTTEIKPLVDKLYPREDFNYMNDDELTWEEKDTIHDSILYDKIDSNCWETGDTIDGEEIICLSFGMSVFNHSCNPNAAVFSIPSSPNSPNSLKSKTPQETYFEFNSVLTIKEIKKGEEICIIYNETAGHYTNESNKQLQSQPFGWVCGCDFNLKERNNAFNHSIREAKKHGLKQLDSIYSMIDQYYLDSSLDYFQVHVHNQTISCIEKHYKECRLKNKPQKYKQTTLFSYFSPCSPREPRENRDSSKPRTNPCY